MHRLDLTYLASLNLPTSISAAPSICRRGQFQIDIFLNAEPSRLHNFSVFLTTIGFYKSISSRSFQLSQLPP
ncbi:unnamed protein product [Arabidopsis halleri]